MVPMQNIIQRIVEHFQIIVKEEYDTTHFIYRVEILSAHTIYDANTLYLAESTGFLSEKASCIPCPEKEMGCYLITTQLPVAPFLPILVTKLPPVRELYLFINERLKFEALLENHISSLSRTLYRDRGLNDIIALAEKLLQYPISICDASYNIIEASSLMRQMTYGLAHSKTRVYLESDEVESLRRNHVVDQIYRSRTAFGVRTVDHPDNLWIFCGIRIQNVMTGYVAVCMGDEVENEYVLRITTALADICSLEMQKAQFYLAHTGLKYESFLIDLLEGHFTDVNIISSRLEILDRKFCKFFCIIVLACMEPHNSDLFNKQQMTTLRASYPNSMSVVYKDSIVLFLNQEKPIDLCEEFTKKLLEFSSLNHMKVGISQPFVDILKIHDFYIQAVDSLKLGEQENPDRMLHFAADLLPAYLFQNGDTIGLEVGIHYHLYHLMGYDHEYHTEFIPTLRAYLNNDRNATKAAESLHIHRSTFFYRIKKIEELLHISITDSHLLFLYELSFQIWDFLSQFKF